MEGACAVFCGAARACSVGGVRGGVPLSRRLAWVLDAGSGDSRTGYLWLRRPPPGRAPQSLVVQGWACGVLLSVFGVVAVSIVKLADAYLVRQVVLPLDGDVLLLVLSLIEFFVEDGVLPVVASEEGNGLFGFLQVVLLVAHFGRHFGWCPFVSIVRLAVASLVHRLGCGVVPVPLLAYAEFPRQLLKVNLLLFPGAHVWPNGCGCCGCWHPAPAW